MTNVSESNLNAMIMVLDPEKELVSGIPTQIWDEDTVQILDLNEVIADPDQDVLSFSVEQMPLYIEVEISQGIATLTPEQDWHGIDTVVFKADDLKGGIVYSKVKLMVKDVPEQPAPIKTASQLLKAINTTKESLISFFSWVRDFVLSYIAYILVGIAILVILLLFMRFNQQILDFLEEDKKRK